MIVEHDFLIWIKNKQNVDRFLIFARSLLLFVIKQVTNNIHITTDVIVLTIIILHHL